MPHVPVLQNPTRRQAQAAHDLIAGAINRQVTGRTAVERQRSRNQIVHEIQTDPRLKHIREASSHYARALERRNAAVIARGLQPNQTETAMELRAVAGNLPRGVRPLAARPVTPEFTGTRAQQLASLKEEAKAFGAASPNRKTPLSPRSQAIRAGRAAASVARERNQYRALPAPKARRIGIGPATVNITPAAIRLGQAAGTLAAQTSLNVGDIGPRNFAKSIGGDVRDIAAGTFTGLEQFTQAGIESTLNNLGLSNDTQATDRFLNMLKETGQGTAQTFRHPVESFQQHPLVTALTFLGAEGALGRGLGGVARGLGKRGAGGIRGGLADIGSTVRSPISFSGDAATAGLKQRTYSKNLFHKGAQAFFDRGRTVLRDSEGNPITVTDRGRTVPVVKPGGTLPYDSSASQIQRMGRQQANFIAGRTQAQEYEARSVVDREFKLKGIRGQTAKDLVAMVVEGTITSAKNFEADLRSYRDMVAREIERHDAGGGVYKTSRQFKDAQATVQRIDKILGNKRVLGQAEKIVAAGEDIGRKLNRAEMEAMAQGILDPKRARRSRLIHPAVLHAGAKHLPADEIMDVPGGGPQAAALHDALAQAVREGDRLTARFNEFGDLSRVPASLWNAMEANTAEQLRLGEQIKAAPSRRGHIEGLKAAVGTARERYNAIARDITQLEHQLSRASGRHASQRGREKGPLRVYKVGDHDFDTRAQAEAYVKDHGGTIRVLARSIPESRRMGEVSRLERAIKNRRADLKKAREDVRAARQQHYEARRRTPKHGSLRTPQGQFLNDKAIEDILRAKGRDPESVAYLPPGALGRRAFHARFNLSRGQIGGAETRTGEQFRSGLTHGDMETVREQGTRLQVQMVKARAMDRAVSDHGMTHPDGRYFTGKEAQEYANRLAGETGEQLIPVRAFPGSADAEMQKLARNLQSPRAMENLGQRLLDDRVKVDDGTKNVVLMPASLVNQLQKHVAPTHTIVRMFQMMNRPFRAAVLAQFRWLTGNFVEPFMVRLPTVGSGVNVFGLAADLRAASRALKTMKGSDSPVLQQTHREVAGQQIGQGLFVGGRGATVRRTLEEMPGSEAYGPVIAKMPVVEQMVQMLRGAGRGLMAPNNAFFKLNRAIENVANRASFGHNIRREVAEMQGSWTKSITLGQKAVDEAVQGLVNTPTQRRFMDAQNELLGKYAGWGPTMRALTQTILPFMPWMLNAARFVFWTMPAHNPVKTAFLQQVNQVVKDDWEKLHGDVPPGNLRYAIPNGKGGWIDVARYMPWGAFTGAAGGDPILEQAVQQVLPQFGGAMAAAQGKTPFGEDLTAPPGTEPNPNAIFFNQLAEAFTPYLSTVRRLREGGGTGYSTSTAWSPKVKPGSSHQSALSRTISPLAPVYLRAPTDGGAAAAAGPSGQRALRRAMRAARRAGGSEAAQERALRRARRAARGGG